MDSILAAFPQWKKGLIVLALILGFYSLKNREPKTFPIFIPTDRQIAAGFIDPCLAKNKCVVVYLAPWCEACSATIPLVLRLRDQWKDSREIGFRIVVGSGKIEESQAEAKNIGDNAMVDEDGSIARGAAVHSFPSWFVLDAGNRILARYGKGFTTSNDPTRDYLLSQLGLR